VAQMVITRAEIAVRFPKLEVKGQRSRSRPDGGMHFDGVELRLTRCLFRFFIVYLSVFIILLLL